VEKSIDYYGIIYSDVARGATKKIIDNKPYYFKHPTQSESFYINSNYNYILSDAKKRGLQTEEENISQAISNGWWSAEKENKFLSIRDAINGLKKTMDNLVLPSQREHIEKEIKKNQYILATFSRERGEIVGYTAEKYANDRLYDEMLLQLTYKNEQLTDRLFADSEEYYYLSDDIVEKIREAFYSCSGPSMSNLLRYVAACPFFQNILYVTPDCDAMSFWGKASSLCTKYQIDLLINGKMFKNAIKSELESGNTVPEEVMNDPDRFVLWYDARNTNLTSKKPVSNVSSKTAVSSFVGATKDDLKKMGVKVEKIRGKSILEMAAENGGVLEKHQYLNARDGG